MKPLAKALQVLLDEYVNYAKDFQEQFSRHLHLRVVLSD